MKKYFIILTISKESFDYDIILSYLRNSPNVDKLSILLDGFMIIIHFDEDSERRKLLSDIVKSDVEDMQVHEIYYEEFLPRSFN